MEQLLLIAAVGVLAQLMGTALGMGYGVTATTMLLLTGLSPLEASTSVHAAEVFTGLAAAASHHRLGNVDRRFVLRLALPGCVGAVAGAAALVALPMASARQYMACLLMSLGVLVLVRHVRGRVPTGTDRPPGRRVLLPLGLGAGFVDASGGGGWGVISTSTLLAVTRTRPRVVVGSVDAAKAIVSAAAVVTLLGGSGGHAVHGSQVLALIAGGVVAAPFGAYVVTRVTVRTFVGAAGVAIVLLNLPAALRMVPPAHQTAVAVGVVVAALAAWATGLVAARHRAPA